MSSALQKDPEDRLTAKQLLAHPFVTQKANIQSLSPYLARVDTIIDKFGSLDKALRAAHMRGIRGDPFVMLIDGFVMWR